MFEIITRPIFFPWGDIKTFFKTSHLQKNINIFYLSSDCTFLRRTWLTLQITKKWCLVRNLFIKHLQCSLTIAVFVWRISYYVQKCSVHFVHEVKGKFLKAKLILRALGVCTKWIHIHLLYLASIWWMYNIK